MMSQLTSSADTAPEVLAVLTGYKITGVQCTTFIYMYNQRFPLTYNICKKIFVKFNVVTIQVSSRFPKTKFYDLKKVGKNFCSTSTRENSKTAKKSLSRF